VSSAAPPVYDELWRDVYGDMQAVGPVHRHMRRLLRGVLGDIPYRTALDVGCGAGDNVPLLREAGAAAKIVGVDVSGGALELARTRHPGRYAQLDIQQEGLAERFDLVFSSLLIEHLDDDLAALRHMRQMTAGKLVVTTIGGDFERYRRWDEQMGHVRNYVPGELEGKLEEAGFVPERIIRWGFPFYSPLARRLQNGMKAEASYGLGSRAAAAFLSGLYFLNSSRRGDLVIAVAGL
jgi:SAM-dependent methyltransferase